MGKWEKVEGQHPVGWKSAEEWKIRLKKDVKKFFLSGTPSAQSESERKTQQVLVWEKGNTEGAQEFSTAFDGISLNSASLEGVTLWCKEAAAGPSHCCSMSFW